MTEPVVFTNLCRVISPDGKWLMEERNDEDYPGVIFPGGHVEKNETFRQAVIREVLEETGLTVLNPVLKGVRHWIGGDTHYVIFVYEATQYEGTLHSSQEGKAFWASPEEVKTLQTTSDFTDNLDILNNPDVSECCYFISPGGTQKIIE